MGPVTQLGKPRHREGGSWPCLGGAGGREVSGKKKSQSLGLPGGPVVKSLPCSAGDMSSTPDPGN